MATAALQTRTEICADLLARFPGMRVLRWNDNLLYASRGYDVVSADLSSPLVHWKKVGSFSPSLNRRITIKFHLSSRLCRDGFHALTMLSSGNLVGAVPGAIVTLRAGEGSFRVTHPIARGTRPLHICSSPDGRALWGEYFENREREEVHVYASGDGGLSWQVAHTFAAGAIRHVHNIVYDQWANCFWAFTGDEGRECRVIRVSRDLAAWDEVLSGSQQCRAVAAVVTPEGVYYASDTPLETNVIYFLDRSGRTNSLATIPSSSIYGCRNQSGIFFSTMIEPSQVNRTRDAIIVGSTDGTEWRQIASWKKDLWPMRLFQFGNVFLPDGDNRSGLLAASTIALNGGDLQTYIWRTRACAS